MYIFDFRSYIILCCQICTLNSVICESLFVLCFDRHIKSLMLVNVIILREHKVVLEDLDKAQVDILHVGSNRKNAADDKLKQLMRRYRSNQETLKCNLEMCRLLE